MITFRRYSYPFKAPFVTAAGTFAQREGIFLEDDALPGKIADAAPLPPFTTYSTEDVWNWLLQNGTENLAEAPFSVLKFAYDCLHNPAPEPEHPVKVNGLVSLHSPDIEVRLKALQLEGVSVVKAKIGVRPDEEAAVLNTLVDRFPGIRWRLDGNMSFSVAAFGAFSAQIPVQALDYYEQPVKTPDLAALAALRKKGLRIYADEAVSDRESALYLITTCAVDGLVFKPQLIGRFAEVQQLVSLAKAKGLGVTFTTLLESEIGTRHTACLAAKLVPEGIHGVGGKFLIEEGTQTNRF
jgi:L-alanine-DL-glutamate epimerase-like enolase superfamily enzyme